MIDGSKTRKSLLGDQVQSLYVIERHSNIGALHFVEYINYTKIVQYMLISNNLIDHSHSPGISECPLCFIVVRHAFAVPKATSHCCRSAGMAALRYMYWSGGIFKSILTESVW